MKFNSKTMSPSAFRADVATLARLIREACEGGGKNGRIPRVRDALQHLSTSPSFSFLFMLVLFATILLSVFRVLPPAATPILLCYPFGLGLVIHSLDAFLSWRDRRLASFLWSLVWVSIFVIINSVLVAVAISW